MANSETIDLRIRTTDAFVYVEVTGEIDVAVTPALRDRLHAVLERGPLVLDLSGVDFLDSTGIGMLIGLLRRADRRGWSMTVVPPHGAARRALDQCGVTEALMGIRV